MNTPVDFRAFSALSAPGGRAAQEGEAVLNTSPDAPERLLQELARMADLLRGSMPREHPMAPPAVTAVVRLVRGLDLPRWRTISDQCDGWFALPLGQSATGMEAPGEAAGPPDAAPAAAYDAATGMARAPLFMEQLTVEVERALHGRRDLALVVFELDGLAVEDGQMTACAARVLSSCLWEAADRRDVLGSLPGGLLALALPAAGRFQALAVAERVVHDVGRRLAEQGRGNCGARAGVAPMEEDGSPEMRAAALLEHARQALDQASRAAAASVRDRVRLFRADEEPAERETLVLASEKQFLFFGGA